MTLIRTVVLCCAVLLIRPVLANDGVFYSKGNTLMPLQETQVRLGKEVLKFHIRDYGYMDVEVDFEFHNPGPARQLTVGFVTSPAYGDVDEASVRHPRISAFTVRHDGREVAFQIQRMKESSFRVGDKVAVGDDFVYYFPITFKPGLNHIRHSYRFQGGGSIETQRDFDYQITTGKRWANGQIDDFELQIHLDQGIFFIPASFHKSGRAANWSLVGEGALGTTEWEFFGPENPKVRMVHLNQGYLQLKETAFKPDHDIFMGEYEWGTGSHWLNRWCRDRRPCVDAGALQNIARYFRLNAGDYADLTELARLDKKELRLLRNFFYALRGYAFKSQDLYRFYSQFFWYRPDTSIQAGDISLTPGEMTFINTIRRLEKRKR